MCILYSVEYRCFRLFILILSFFYLTSFFCSLGITFKPLNAQGLEKATPSDLAEIEISPSGLGLHIPALDVDLYLPALLDGFLGSRKWMAATMGKVGGQTSTQAKAAAARANGKLGGRPKKERDTAHAQVLASSCK